MVTTAHHSATHDNLLVTHDGIKVYYQANFIGGRDRVLFFLHGIGGDLEAWNKERELLHMMGYSTIAMDLRGHGLSDHPIEENFYKLENFALDVQDVLQHEKIEKVILVGHCFGGMVAMQTATSCPDILEGLILIDTSYKAPYLASLLAQKQFINKLISTLAKYSPNPHVPRHSDYSEITYAKDYDWPGLFKTILHNSLRSYLLSSREALNIDGLELLKQIHVPTLVIVGEKDSIFPEEISKEIHHRIRKSEFDVIKGGNHVVVVNNPSELLVSIRKFLDKLEFTPLNTVASL